jgi:Na+/melibiose symporter-like transporter
VFKLGMGLGVFVALGFLSQGGYVDMSQVLDPQVENTVRIGASWLPAVMLLVPIAMMWNYPIDNLRHAEIRRELDARRQARAGR